MGALGQSDVALRSLHQGYHVALARGSMRPKAHDPLQRLRNLRPLWMAAIEAQIEAVRR
jgi:hypothetical protein